MARKYPNRGVQLLPAPVMEKDDKGRFKNRRTKDHILNDMRIARGVKDLIHMLAKGLSEDVEAWIREAAEQDPRAGAELWLKLAEFCVPKLARMEVGVEKLSDAEILAELERREVEARKLVETEVVDANLSEDAEIVN